MTFMQYFEVDHLDPRWTEGRDYQLVCGLDIHFNYSMASVSENRSKSNRFLPYRGEAPVSKGDLCWFLNLTTQEWELHPFLGDWWYEQTKSLCGNAFGGRDKSLEWIEANAAPQRGKKRPSYPKNRKSRPWSAERRANHPETYNK